MSVYTIEEYPQLREGIRFIMGCFEDAVWSPYCRRHKPKATVGNYGVRGKNMGVSFTTVECWAIILAAVCAHLAHCLTVSPQVQRVRLQDVSGAHLPCSSSALGQDR